jgi:DNA-binding response OmpR family regulator
MSKTNKKHKILLMEDEAVLGEIYKKALEEAGFEVEWRKTTKETEETAKTFKPEVILLDHGIRGEDRSGLDILPGLKKILPDSDIIMLSNYAQEQLEKATLKAGAIGYLIKLDTPPAMLVEYINKLLS